MENIKLHLAKEKREKNEVKQRYAPQIIVLVCMHELRMKMKRFKDGAGLIVQQKPGKNGEIWHILAVKIVQCSEGTHRTCRYLWIS